jgi:hypothetical protein
MIFNIVEFNYTKTKYSCCKNRKSSTFKQKKNELTLANSFFVKCKKTELFDKVFEG